MATYTTIPTFTAGQILRADGDGSTYAGMNDLKNNLDLTNAQSAYPFRNLLYNGAMQISQRGTSTASISNAYAHYTADRWVTYAGTLGTWTQSIENDAPTGTGLRRSLKMLCTTADASPAAGDLLRIQQSLEGFDVQRVAKGTTGAQALTLTFWVKSNVTGTYIAELYDEDNTRSVSKSYTVSASGTWEQKTLTFPADTTGVNDNDNAASLTLILHLAEGSTYTSGTLATTWGAVTNANRAVGQTNLASATSNYWQVTGVQLETGSVSTPFEFLPYTDDLRRCQRYFYTVASGNNVAVFNPHWYDGSNGYGVISFPAMRSGPVLDIITGAGYYTWLSQGANGTVTTLAYQEAGTTSITLSVSASNTAGRNGWVRTSNASARVALSAEL